MPEVAAEALTARVRCLDEVYRTGYIERGLICREMRDRSLWRLVLDSSGVPYHSMDAWILGSAPWSRRDCYAAMRSADALADVPIEQLAQMPRCNIALLERCSSQVRTQPEVLEAASTLSEMDFAGKLEHDHPNQHIEAKSVRWMLPGSLARLAGEAIDVAMVRQDARTREEALEAIFADYIATYGVQMQ